MEPASAALPRAVIGHLLPGRVRLHFPAERGRPAFFEQITTSLRELPPIREVHANARTGSMLLLHAGEFEHLARLARERGLFAMPEIPKKTPAPAGAQQEPRRPPAVQPLVLASLGFAALGVVQTLRGRFHGNAAESLWNAYLFQAVGARATTSAALAALSLFQLATGRALGSGVSLFLYALAAHTLARVKADQG